MGERLSFDRQRQSLAHERHSRPGPAHLDVLATSATTEINRAAAVMSMATTASRTPVALPHHVEECSLHRRDPDPSARARARSGRGEPGRSSTRGSSCSMRPASTSGTGSAPPTPVCAVEVRRAVPPQRRPAPHRAVTPDAVSLLEDALLHDRVVDRRRHVQTGRRLAPARAARLLLRRTRSRPWDRRARASPGRRDAHTADSNADTPWHLGPFRARPSRARHAMEYRVSGAGLSRRRPRRGGAGGTPARGAW